MTYKKKQTVIIYYQNTSFLCTLLSATKRGKLRLFLHLCHVIKSSGELIVARTDSSVDDIVSEELRHCYGLLSPSI